MKCVKVSVVNWLTLHCYCFFFLHHMIYSSHYDWKIPGFLYDSHFWRLAAGEWFIARVSASGLFHVAYPSAPEALKTELQGIYSQLCQYDMLMVRRSVATNLRKFAPTVEAVHLKTDILSIFEDLTQDRMQILTYVSLSTNTFCKVAILDFFRLWFNPIENTCITTNRICIYSLSDNRWYICTEEIESHIFYYSSLAWLCSQLFY